MLSPSERVILIIEISEELAKSEWSIIDLTLRQFGLPTTDQWNSEDRKGYIVSMIDKANDEPLAQLHYHLTSKNNKAPQNAPEFWQPGTLKLFISHLNTSKKKATLIQKELERYHISSFVAHKDIKPTKEWQDEIELALDTCDATLALLTKKFNESEWTDQELGISMGNGSLIISLDIGMKPYGFLSKYQKLSGRRKTIEKIGKEIFQILLKHNLTKSKMSAAIVNKFESSYSFDNSKENMILIEQLDYIDTDLIKRLKKALETNSQIRESFTVAPKLRSFIRSIESS
jgi:hypothetical protein